MAGTLPDPHWLSPLAPSLVQARPVSLFFAAVASLLIREPFRNARSRTLLASVAISAIRCALPLNPKWALLNSMTLEMKF
eukprot:1146419-Pelagomonas_calceolata.AAC.8